MKQYTTPEQTAKLIELGFAPKMRIKGVSTKYGTVNVEHETYFDVGELIEILPMNINNDGSFEEILIHINYGRWVVKYSGIFREPTYQICRKELIDALYTMIVELKDEGAI